MLLGFIVGSGVTLFFGGLFAWLLWWRNRKLLVLVPRESLISKALQAHYRPHALTYQEYPRRKI